MAGSRACSEICLAWATFVTMLLAKAPPFFGDGVLPGSLNRLFFAKCASSFSRWSLSASCCLEMVSFWS